MPDFLISRYIPNAPNEESGAWVDVTIVRDLKADEAQKAAEKSGATGQLRVSRWDTTEEYTGQPGPPILSKVTKVGI